MRHPTGPAISFARLPEIAAEVILEHMSDPRVAEHMPLLTPGWDLDTVAQFVSAKEQRWHLDGLGHWAILADDVYVGWGGFQKEGDAWDFGLVLKPETFGLGPRILRKALEFARADPRIPWVTFLVPPSRKRLGALQRLGATFVAEIDYDGTTFLKYRVMTKSSGQSLPSLLKEVRACRICADHLPSGPRPVVQVDPRARILIVGQAPGRRVHESGVPFDDPSGDRLRRWMGVDRDTFYDPTLVAILPMGFCYPGTGRSGDFPPRPECAPAWRQSLLDHLTAIDLTLVIGQYAQAWHLGPQSGGVTEVVRQWRSQWPRVLPLPHPSPRNQMWTRKNPWFEKDVVPALQRRIAELISSGGALP